MRFFVAFLVASAVAIDATQAKETFFDGNIFPTGYAILLGFDLKNDEQPIASLIVNGSASLPTSDINVMLPFKISEEGTNEKALFRVGRYSNRTVITFWNDPNVGVQGISFLPNVETSTAAYTANDPSTTIYLLSEGQNRRLIPIPDQNDLAM